jgi:hypothetical protein
VFVVGGALVVAAVAGCSAGPDQDAAASAATAFVSALHAHSGVEACGMLTSEAYSSASGATDTPCPEAITSIQVKGTKVTAVQVWGDAAQVRLGSDVLFLRHISGRWLISAAGCEPKPEGPYDCSVSS